MAGSILPSMRLLRRLLSSTPPTTESDTGRSLSDEQRSSEDPESHSWYVPSDAPASRFISPDGLPALRLIPYVDTSGEQVLRLIEDSSGLLVSPSHRSLAKAGIFVSQLRGESYHEASCRQGDFSPGATVRLVWEPANPHDENAVAVYDATGRHLAAYVNKQKARALSRLLDAGTELRAVSVRGTAARRPCLQVAIVAAEPTALERLQSARPASSPKPAFLT